MKVEVTSNMAKATVSGTSISVAVEPAISVIQVGTGGLQSMDAENVAIADAGGYYESGNVEGALQEAGADLSNIDISISNIDGRLTTAEGEIDALQSSVATNTANIATNTSNIATNTANIATLQSEVAAIVEPQSGYSIVVDNDGAINLGSSVDSGIQAIGTRYIRGQFLLQLKDPDTGNLIEFDAELGTISGSSISVIQAGAKQFESPIQTLTNNAGSIAWNMNLGNHARITLSASGTLQNPTNLPASTTAIFPSLEVIQDNAGGRVLSFGSAYKFPRTYIAPGTDGNSRALYNFYLRSDGNIGVVATYYTS